MITKITIVFTLMLIGCAEEPASCELHDSDSVSVDTRVSDMFNGQTAFQYCSDWCGAMGGRLDAVELTAASNTGFTYYPNGNEHLSCFCSIVEAP